MVSTRKYFNFWKYKPSSFFLWKLYCLTFDFLKFYYLVINLFFLFEIVDINHKHNPFGIDSDLPRLWSQGGRRKFISTNVKLVIIFHYRMTPNFPISCMSCPPLAKIFLVQNCVNDWRIAMTWQRIFQICFELVICAVHPIPGEPYFFWKNDIINAVGSRWVPNDVVFSLPMFLRFYLIARSMHLHK